MRLFRVLGVPVVVMPSWFVLATLTVALYGPVLGGGGARGYATATAFAVGLLVSVLLHEVGHCVVARLLGLPVRSITVTFLAGLTEITQPPQTPGREYAVAVSGPLVSLLLAGVGAAGTQALPEDGAAQTVCGLLAAANALLAVFNLLPGLPLDGGRVLRSAVWRLTGDPTRATVVSAQAGRGLALAVVPLLLVGLLLADVALSVTTAVFAVLVAGFLHTGATASLRAARLTRRLPAVTVAALARPALAVPADLPLAEALRRADEASVHAIVVVDADGRPRAVVSEAAVQAVPGPRRPWVSTGSVARRLEAGLLLDPALAGEPLLAALRSTPATEYVTEDAGLLRVLSAADVGRAVQGLAPADAAGRSPAGG